MNPTTVLSAQPVFHRLAATLVQFLWQGALVALLYAAVRSILPRSKAQARYAVGCGALLLMLVLPIATFSTTPAMPRPATSGARVTSNAPRAAGAHAAPSTVMADPAALELLRRAKDTVEPWLFLVWIAGVCLLSLRFLIGWAAIEHLRRRWLVEPPETLVRSLEGVARRVRVSRSVKIVLSAAVRVPTALGLFRPVILMPLTSLSGFSVDEIEAMLAHELAHIRRHDYLVNLAQSLAETLLFYHPAVWWIGRTIRSEREHCCDDIAVVATGDVRRYARALLRLEEVRSMPIPFAVAADGGTLSARVLRLLPNGRGPSLSSRVGASVIGILALVVIVGAGGRIALPGGDPDGAQELLSVSNLSASTPHAAAVLSSASPPAASAGSRPSRRTSRVPTRGSSEPKTAPPDSDQTADPEEKAPAALPSERLEEFRMHGVTPEFVRGIQEQGYQSASADTLVSLRIHGVDAAYIREINELFGRRLSLDECVSLRIHGVTPAYVREMFSSLPKASSDDIEALRIHGVSADYLRQFREAGYPALSVGTAIEMRNHGVDPAVARELVRLGFVKPPVDELRTARDHGVSVDYVRGMREVGLAPTSLDVLVSLRNHGVTPEFVRSIQGLGYSALSAEEATSLRNHGVTPEFVKSIQDLGYTGLTIDDLLSLRNRGVTAPFIRKANAASGKRLSVDELIEHRNWEKE